MTAHEKQEVEAPVLPARLSRMSSLTSSWSNSAGNDSDHYRVCKLLREATLYGVVTWVFFLGIVIYISPPETFEYMEETEKNANLLVFILLFVTNGSRLLPYFFRNNPMQIMNSGVMLGSCAVQGIALSSSGLMMLFPTPVLVDQVTGTRVHLVRWVEWTVLSFLMTFLTEGIDLPNHKQGEKLAWNHGIAIALSTVAGIIFPLCPDMYWWMLTFIISCILFCSIYIRLYYRYERYNSSEQGNGVESEEAYNRVRLSLRLLQVCSFMWTMLVVGFTVCNIGAVYAGEDSILKNPSNQLVVESFFEVGSKIWYLNVIIEVHDLIFDEGARALRRLQELRDMMSIVWEDSSDVIALSIRTNKRIITMVSPKFLLLPFNKNCETTSNGNANGNAPPTADNASDNRAVLVLEMSEETTGPNFFEVKAYTLNLDDVMAKKEANVAQRGQKVNIDAPTTLSRNIHAMVDLLGKSWECEERESLIMHDMHGKATDGKDCQVRCEAKVTRLEKDAAVVVVRDISERFRRFEAEKKLVIEVTERKKDIEANRFTRHEVKNGLLAAIALVDSLRETAEKQEFAELTGKTKDELLKIADKNNQKIHPSNSSDAICALSGENETKRRADEGYSIQPRKKHCNGSNLSNSMEELDSTLREVLDTVMAEAMARDVIHEVYEPKLERTDVYTLFNGVRSGKDGNLRQSERFPIVCYPSPLPQIIVDPQLLRYVHRNAISNACKYGRAGGVVLTDIHFDAGKKEFRLEVINKPGEQHDELVQLDDDAVASVFSAGTRLHRQLSSHTMYSDEPVSSHSAGDGAWIMQKCAKTLGGQCDIRFEEHQTIFSMSCPAGAFEELEKSHDTLSVPNFQIPRNTWGIALDDSAIQRKLLDRFLSVARIRKDRRIVLGTDASEVRGFNDVLKKLLKDNPDDRFLVIVDENLDIVEEDTCHKTISGSLTVEMLRKQLHPDDESRLLALVRSANDSREDITLYKGRAHGFIPKAPIQKDRVLEMIEPLWRKRFGSKDCFSYDSEDTEGSGTDIAVVTSSEDLMRTVEVIDVLCTQSQPSALPARWPAIWDKLHTLKGDIKTMKSNARVKTILEAIDNLRGDRLPDELLERWKLVRALIVSII